MTRKQLGHRLAMLASRLETLTPGDVRTQDGVSAARGALHLISRALHEACDGEDIMPDLTPAER